ncbi:MAG: methyltransferase [Spirochaetales bacterium]|nr:methyltransferase [Spirochaetales bacterium]
MTSRERVTTSLDHEQPDKVPIDFGGTSVTGLHASCVAGLRDYYGLEKRLVKVHEPSQCLGYIEEDLQEAIGVDVVSVNSRTTKFGFPNATWKEWTMQDGLKVLVSSDFNTEVDGKGDTLLYPQGDTSVPPSARMPEGGNFFDAIVRQEPIDDDNLRVEDNLEEYGPIGQEDLAYLVDQAERAVATGKGVVGNFSGTALGDISGIPGPKLKHPKGIRDIEEWYISVAIRQDYVAELFEMQTEIGIENYGAIYSAIGDSIDALVVCGTDFGTQESTFCSLDTYRALWKPNYQRINDWIHGNTNWKTFKHCCGAIASFMPDFIESGFDIINPVQLSASGMDAASLKREYGNDIAFWGGGVDTQSTLPFGDPEEIREQVLERCSIFARDGGFVFNTIHNIQAHTPIENIVAVIDAVKEFNGDR